LLYSLCTALSHEEVVGEYRCFNNDEQKIGFQA
jgi:hypothetical protein